MERTSSIGKKISGTVLERTGTAFVLDMEFVFFKVRLDDGSITEASAARCEGVPDAGSHFDARAVYPMFRPDRRLFPFGANEPAMPMFAEIQATPPSRVIGPIRRMVARAYAALIQ